jgi:AcrR family transcriptional regulator
MATTRRDRHRAATEAELRAAARAELVAHGAGELSLRRVARRMGMSPAGLYRYVDSREGLLTLLITDALDELGAAVAAAVAAAGPDADVADRVTASWFGYRDWAVAHPREFGLVFGEPLPGYAAPEGGPTVAAMARFARALADPLVDAWRAGRLHLPPELDRPELAAATEPMAADLPGLPPGAYALFLVVWGRLHGHVALEVFGHHRWIFPDGALDLYRAEVDLLVDHLGLGP